MSWWQTDEDKVNDTITVTDEWHGNPNVVLGAPDFGYPDTRYDQEGNRWDRDENDGSWHQSLWP